MAKPLIGVTPCYDYDNRTTYIKYGYCEGLNEAGAVSFLIPAVTNELILDEIFESLDGLLLSGGPDIDARLYNEENLPFNDCISPLRDNLELYLAKKVLESGKPVLGICRGIQIMNVAAGGTLYQDIGSQITSSTVLKHSQQAPKWHPTHDIRVSQGSKVWKVFKKQFISVNTFHHQAIKDVAAGFVVTSSTSDGVIESIEHTQHTFAVGIQWHPELMWENYPEQLNLFKLFVDSCR